jgi:hypothetical protein
LPTIALLSAPMPMKVPDVPLRARPLPMSGGIGSVIEPSYFGFWAGGACEPLSWCVGSSSDMSTPASGAMLCGFPRPSWRRASRSARRNASTDCQRSSFLKRSAMSIAAAIGPGTSGATIAIERALIVAAARSFACTFAPRCTVSPVSAVNIVAPSDQMSERLSTLSRDPIACSGDMKDGVPSTSPNMESLLCPARSKTRATPKSRSFT